VARREELLVEVKTKFNHMKAPFLLAREE